MDANGEVAIEIGQYRGEKMLSCMLLHVVEPAGPIHLTGSSLTRQGFGKEVGNPFPLVHHVGDLDAAEPTGVEQLPTRAGIKGGAIEVDASSLLTSLHDGGFEVAQVGVGIIESLGHGNPGPRKGVG
jgi:hypothetical protein